MGEKSGVRKAECGNGFGYGRGASSDESSESPNWKDEYSIKEGVDLRRTGSWY